MCAILTSHKEVAIRTQPVSVLCHESYPPGSTWDALRGVFLGDSTPKAEGGGNVVLAKIKQELDLSCLDFFLAC